MIMHHENVYTGLLRHHRKGKGYLSNPHISATYPRRMTTRQPRLRAKTGGVSKGVVFFKF